MMLVPTANRDAAEALIGGLLAGGVKHAVLSPGSRSAPLVLAVARAAARGKLSVHTILDERTAAFFALGIARTSGLPVVLIATSGSAGAHFHPAVIEACEARVPLIVLTADRPPELRDSGAPQTTDQRRLFGVHARYSADLPVPEPGLAGRLYSAAAVRAVIEARGSAPGPAHLNVAFREPLWSPAVEAVPLPPLPRHDVLIGRPTLDARARAELLDLLVRQPRGLLVIGPTPGDPRDGELGDAALALARALSWPVIADAAASPRRSREAEELVLRGDAILRSQKTARLLAPELVIRVGRAPSSRAIGEWLGREATGKSVILDAIGAAADPQHSGAMVVAADPASTLRAMAEELASIWHAPEPAAREYLAAWKRAELKVEQEIARAHDALLWEGALPALISEALPDQALVHLGNGMPVRDFDNFEPRSARRRTVLASRGVNGIDGTLATAIGELIGSESSGPLVAVIGDLTALHDLSGLRLLAEQKRPVIAVVIDNGGGGIFDFLPIAQHPEAYEAHFLTPQPVNVPAIALALGLRTRSAKTLEEVRQGLGEAIASAEPSLLCITVDRRASVARHKQLWSEIERALDLAATDETRRGPAHDPSIHQSA